MRMVTSSLPNPTRSDYPMMVTSYWFARERAAEFDPVTIISLMDPGAPYSVPAGANLKEHIKIGVHDAPSDHPALRKQYTVPTEGHVRRIIEFAQSWDGSGRVLVHCTGGVSRSTAAALVLLSARNPGREIEIARLIRTRGPWASPNPLIVRIADKLLGRRGALISAFVKMGPPAMSGVPEPIFLPSVFSD
jgi:predicted protein tyrosine phosphatase